VDLQALLPAHSIPPSMIAKLDDLEEALALAQRQLRQETAGQNSEETDFDCGQL